METLRNVSLFGLLSLVLTLTPLAMAFAYVIRPSERRLALMRPLSLAGLFAALTGTAIGFINVFVGLGEAWIHDGDVHHLGHWHRRIAGATISWLRVSDSGMVAGRRRDGTSERLIGWS